MCLGDTPPSRNISVIMYRCSQHLSTVQGFVQALLACTTCTLPVASRYSTTVRVLVPLVLKDYKKATKNSTRCGLGLGATPPSRDSSVSIRRCFLDTPHGHVRAGHCLPALLVRRVHMLLRFVNLLLQQLLYLSCC